MKLTIIASIFLSFWTFFHRTADINALKREAEAAYRAKDYNLVIRNYSTLIKEYKQDDISIWFNLANSYFKILQYKEAEKLYLKIIQRNDDQKASYALNQLGIIYFRSGNYKKALLEFKKALERWHHNKHARYNYELVKKLIEEQLPYMDNSSHDKKSKKKEQAIRWTQHGPENVIQQDESVDYNPGTFKQNKSSQQFSNSDHQQTEVIPGSNGKNKKMNTYTSARLMKMNLNLKRAEFLLEIMKNSEVQYIHQLPKNSSTTPPYDGPDW